MNAQAIQTGIIEVKYVNPPKGDAKQATIKDASGELYGVWPKDLGRYQPGRRYRIEYTERAYQGRTYRTVVKCDAEPTGQPQAAVAPRASPAPSGEVEFVTRLLAASIQACAVGHTEAALVQEARMLREVWAQVFGG